MLCWAQAVELDDAQRELSDTIASKQALATAQATEAGLRRRLAELQQQLGAAASGSGGGSSDSNPTGGAAALQRELAAAQDAAAVARQDAERLREECEARELEVMQLQGQVRLLQQQATEAESWLMSPG